MSTTCHLHELQHLETPAATLKLALRGSCYLLVLHLMETLKLWFCTLRPLFPQIQSASYMALRTHQNPAADYSRRSSHIDLFVLISGPQRYLTEKQLLYHVTLS